MPFKESHSTRSWIGFPLRSPRNTCLFAAPPLKLIALVFLPWPHPYPPCLSRFKGSLFQAVRAALRLERFKFQVHITRHFLAQEHLSDKAFVIVLGLCSISFMTLVVNWPFFCTMNLKKRSLEPDLWRQPISEASVLSYQALRFHVVGNSRRIAFSSLSFDVGLAGKALSYVKPFGLV